MNPVIYKIIDKNDFGDNVVLFYFAALVKESLKAINDKDIKEAVLTFMLDEW